MCTIDPLQPCASSGILQPASEWSIFCRLTAGCQKRSKVMCWYSAAHSGQELQQAEVGQRLGVRKMHSGACWVVKETEIQSTRPAPVCLLDGTKALFRPTE